MHEIDESSRTHYPVPPPEQIVERAGRVAAPTPIEGAERVAAQKPTMPEAEQRFPVSAPDFVASAPRVAVERPAAIEATPLAVSRRPEAVDREGHRTAVTRQQPMPTLRDHDHEKPYTLRLNLRNEPETI